MAGNAGLLRLSLAMTAKQGPSQQPGIQAKKSKVFRPCWVSEFAPGTRSANTLLIMQDLRGCASQFLYRLGVLGAVEYVGAVFPPKTWTRMLASNFILQKRAKKFRSRIALSDRAKSE
jgi:hypothetical protein